MTVYYVDDGGSATSPYDTWAKAATSLSALDDAITLASGDIVYVGHDHVCQYTHAANRSITGPTADPPCVIISATQGSDPPAYQKSSTAQIDTTEGAYFLALDGAFAFYGIKITTGLTLTCNNDLDETIEFNDCTLVIPSQGNIYPFNVVGANTLFVNCTVDAANTGSTVSPFEGNNTGKTTLRQVSFVNVAARTGTVIRPMIGEWDISGCDFSGFTNATLCEIFASPSRACTITNCLTAATWGLYSARPTGFGSILATNVGPVDDPTALRYVTAHGDIVSTTGVYRTSGATVETVPGAWLVTTESTCSVQALLRSPWIYGTVASTGSRTFDLYITNDTADFTDAEVWLEVEYLKDADEALWTLATDQRATITTTAAAQTDDTTSTWNGTGPSFTYKQRLSVTATVGETGQYRARVVVGAASIAGSRYFYVDPVVTVT